MLRLVHSNNTPVIANSLQVAAFLGRRHSRVLRAIAQLDPADFVPVGIVIHGRTRRALGMTVAGFIAFGFNLRGHGPEVKKFRSLAIKTYIAMVPQEVRIAGLRNLGLEPVASR